MPLIGPEKSTKTVSTNSAERAPRKGKLEAIKYCPKHGRFCPPGCKLSA